MGSGLFGFWNLPLSPSNCVFSLGLGGRLSYSALAEAAGTKRLVFVDTVREAGNRVVPH